MTVVASCTDEMDVSVMLSLGSCLFCFCNKEYSSFSVDGMEGGTASYIL